MTSDIVSESSILDATPKPNLIVKVTETPIAAMALDPLSHVGDGIFLQTNMAQVLAGAFTWLALFITCQQVSDFFRNRERIYGGTCSKTQISNKYLTSCET
jgi:hypothetical protein